METLPNSSFDVEPRAAEKVSGSKESGRKALPWSPDRPPQWRPEQTKTDTPSPEHEKRQPFYASEERTPDTHAERMIPDQAAEDLGSTAVREEHEHLERYFRARETESAKNEKDGKVLPEPAAETHRAEAEPVASTQDKAEEPVHHAPESEAAEHAPVEPFADHPEVARDLSVQEVFDDFVQQHRELADLSAEEVGAETSESATARLPEDDGEAAAFAEPEAAHASDPEVSEVPEPAAGEGGEQPPFPPEDETAEGGEYEEPEGGQPFGVAMSPNPRLAENPWLLAGDLENPAMVSRITNLEAQRDLDNLRNQSRDRGLAAAVGVLGLGLLLEHFSAKRRDKRQMRQIKAQGKEIHSLAKSRDEEQRSHERTREEVQSMRREQYVANEQERYRRDVQPRALERQVVSPARAAEVVAGTVAAAELAKRSQQTHDAEIVRKERENTRVITDRSNERVATLTQERSELTQRLATQERTETTANTLATVATEELRHERLQDKLADAGGVNGTATVPRQQGFDPVPTQSAAAPKDPALARAQASLAAQKTEHASMLASRWTWAIIGLIVVAVIAAVIR